MCYRDENETKQGLPRASKIMLSPRTVISAPPPATASPALRTLKGVAARCSVANGGRVKLSLSLACVASGATRTAERALQRAARRARAATRLVLRAQWRKPLLPPFLPLPPPRPPPPPPPPQTADLRAVRVSLSVDVRGGVALLVQPCGASERRPVKNVTARLAVQGSGRIKLQLALCCFGGGTGAELRTAERAAARSRATQAKREAEEQQSVRRRQARALMPGRERSRRLLHFLHRRLLAATRIASTARGRFARLEATRRRAERDRCAETIIDGFLGSLAPDPAGMSTILQHSRRPSHQPLVTTLATAWPSEWRKHLAEQERERERWMPWSRQRVVFADGHPHRVFQFSEEPGRPLREGVPLIGREMGFEWD